MKNPIYLLLFLALPFISVAQEKEIIRQQALLVAKATKALDFPTIIKYTHPALIKVVGGPDAMLIMIKKGMEALAIQGLSIDSVAIGTPEDIFKAGKELHCLVPEAIVMTVPDGKLISKTYLLAISGDNGTNWTFIEISDQINNKTITQLLPNFNQDLRIPENTKPVFYKDDNN